MTLDAILLRPTRSQLKLWEKLHLAKYRKKEGLFLAEGLRVVNEILKSDWSAKAILVMKGKESIWYRSLSAAPEETPIYQLTEKEWNKISQDKTPEGIAALAAIPQCPDISVIFDKEHSGHLLLLDGIKNPANLGAILRTADWFGVGNILLGTGSVDFTNPKVVRSAMGSLFRVTIFPDVDFMKTMQDIKKHYFLIGTDKMVGKAPRSLERKAAVLLGSESHGLNPELAGMADELWCIQGVGGGDSLSLPQAAAIVMYELTRLK